MCLSFLKVKWILFLDDWLPSRILVSYNSCRWSWRGKARRMHGRQCRTEYRHFLLLLKSSLCKSAFILTLAHKLGKNTSPSDASRSFWKINLMRQSRLLTLKRNFLFATNVLDFKILIHLKRKVFFAMISKLPI